MRYILIHIIFFAFVSSVFAQTETNRLRTEALDNISIGKFGEAIELLNRYISANPQISEGFNLRGVCFEKRGEYEKAVYDFRSALKLDHDNPVYQSNLARTTIEFDKILYNTIAGYKREIAINPKNPKNYLEVGKSYKKLGEWLEAEKWYDDYLGREEASSDEVIRYSEILVKTGHISKGEPILREYTEKYPQDHRLWSRYGYFTMWLGKKQIALHAFETALELRPYFKEAMDGYDLVRGKGYIYTVNDTTSRYNYGLPTSKRTKHYVIDKYFYRLKRNPSDKETRYLLIDELVKKNRFEEAGIQLNFLARTESSESRFLNKKEEVEAKKENYYKEKILTLEKQLQKTPGNRKTIIELVRFYSYYGDYYKAIDITNNYLIENPADKEIMYQQAKLYSQTGELGAARDEMKKLINISPDSLDYQLFFGQLSVWLNTGLVEAKESLEFVLTKKPGNLDALISLTMLNLQQNDLASTETYLNEGLQIEPDNNELLRLKKSIVIQRGKNKEAAAFKILEKARKYLFRKNCDDAVRTYKKYFLDEYSDASLKKELAQAYICSDNYDEAINIYEEMVNQFPKDTLLQKELAKTYYWSGDSLSALFLFERLYASNNDDAEVKLYLGDSYTKVGDYENAKLIYEEMLETAPSSHILQTRLSWLGSEGLYGSSFPTYFSIVPSATYFSDDLDFTYHTQGLKLESGLTRFLSLSVGGYIGALASADKRLNLNIFYANGTILFSKHVKGMVGAGITSFDNDQQSNIFEASLTAEKESKYKFSLSFFAADAAQILYSPFLVDIRLNSTFTSLAGEFTTNDKIILGGEFSYITVSDDNNGNRLALLLGRAFDKVFKAGYEYFYYKFNDQKAEYWSPEKFETHSAWVDWNAISESELQLNLKGKVGIVPVENFVVKELQGILKYIFTSNFVLQTSAAIGNTVRSDQGYNSLSVAMSIFWTL